MTYKPKQPDRQYRLTLSNGRKWWAVTKNAKEAVAEFYGLNIKGVSVQIVERQYEDEFITVPHLSWKKAVPE